MGSERTHLFVYGTLLSGEPAHHLLENAPLVAGDACTQAHFRLIDLGGYPGIVAGDTRIHGEVYAVEPRVFDNLDDYEDAHDEYHRVTITLQDGTQAMTYAYRGPRTARATPIPSGDWRLRR